MEEKKPEVGAPTEAERAASGAEKSSNAPHTDGAPDQPSSGLIAASESDWPFPPAHLDLADQEIHVWRAWLDELAPDLPSFTETLSASERNRAARFQFERDRNRFILRRGLLRRILGRYLNLDPAQLSFTYEARGKPSLAGTVDAPTIHFNLSHSEGLALFAVTRSAPFGIDLERVRPLHPPGVDATVARLRARIGPDFLTARRSRNRRAGFVSGHPAKPAPVGAESDGTCCHWLELPQRKQRTSGGLPLADAGCFSTKAPQTGQLACAFSRAICIRCSVSSSVQDRN